jgi:aldehyde dehydrogenase (NAD+)
MPSRLPARRLFFNESPHMRECLDFYIGGRWGRPAQPRIIDIVNPATGRPAGRLALGSEHEVDAAVQAARSAAPGYAATTRTERMELLSSILAAYEARAEDLAAAVTEEMGAPLWLSRQAHVPSGAEHMQNALDVLKDFSFEEFRGPTLLRFEPIGVCGLITPWNWPLNQVTAMLAPALAVGCTVVWKPSEFAAISARIFAQVLHEAGVPPGVFNMIQGDGATVGTALSAHSGVDMVSFTGSTRAGIEVARNAAPTIKRVQQELGGKSPNIILDDADLEKAVSAGVLAAMRNSGQTCTAPTRMLVPLKFMHDVCKIARETVDGIRVGAPESDVHIGPVVSEAQWDKIQLMIASGLREGATLVAGGLGRPTGLESGFFVKPTVFADVTSEMRIAREEIFGPVLSVLGYEDEDEAVAMANDTPYGLAAYIQSGNPERARGVASRLQAGQVRINAPGEDAMAPFGGYKQSGNGREGGRFGFAGYLEVKAVLGLQPAAR